MQSKIKHGFLVENRVGKNWILLGIFRFHHAALEYMNWRKSLPENRNFDYRLIDGMFYHRRGNE